MMVAHGIPRLVLPGAGCLFETRLDLIGVDRLRSEVVGLVDSAYALFD